MGLILKIKLLKLKHIVDQDCFKLQLFLRVLLFSKKTSF